MVNAQLATIHALSYKIFLKKITGTIFLFTDTFINTAWLLNILYATQQAWFIKQSIAYAGSLHLVKQ